MSVWLKHTLSRRSMTSFLDVLQEVRAGGNHTDADALAMNRILHDAWTERLW